VGLEEHVGALLLMSWYSIEHFLYITLEDEKLKMQQKNFKLLEILLLIMLHITMPNLA
jgi:hypothetical protein